MDGRLLGRTGLTVPALGLGTVKLGRNRDVKYPRAFELPDDRAVTMLLEAAIDEGVVLWDTAPAYGIAEERLGRHVERFRDRIVLCSKAGEEYDDDGSSYDFSADAIVASVTRSLRRLRTDHLDLLLLHSHGRDLEILEQTDALDGLRRLKEAGDVRCVGISAKTVDGIERAARELDVVMAPVNDELEDVLSAVAHAGCGVLGIKVFGQGHAVDGADDVERALSRALDTFGVHTAIIGTKDATHLREAAAAARNVLARGRGDTA